MNVHIRPISPQDNAPLAALIRQIFREFGIDRPGTVYTDRDTDRLYEVFQHPKSAYWIAEEEGQIIGGCGIYPTEGLPEGCAELAKFYLLPQSRGRGIGRLLMEKSLSSARELGYKQIYLESFPELSGAVSMYRKAGFKDLPHSWGNSGHFACTIWMVKSLE
ncbi:GNAT family N-acetyltransferase [Parabacteroides sp. FAFU027]|uniref:GNAT family N-acetyltransferase n=1 Tax=Parabacteroides sp. FAFU027 TaxID=2922715 RepID=UPI001FAF64E4|nr:GNAT family N-acetyltransferase [Parabacteroides sp. FAFU027]